MLGGFLLVAVAAIVAAAIAARDARPSPGAALAKGTLLSASADLFPQSFLFGQAVHVEVDAVLDHRKLDPNRVQLDANWSPYAPVTPMTRARADVGSYTKLQWRVDLHCITLRCAPQVGSNIRNVFQPTTVRYAGHVSGATAPSVTVTWPTVIAWSREDPIDQERKAVVRKTGTLVGRQVAAFTPPWHVNTSLAAVSYRIGPTTLFWASLAVALTLVLAAALLLRPYLPTPAWVRRPPHHTKHERAQLEVVRAPRPPPTVPRAGGRCWGPRPPTAGRSRSERRWSCSRPSYGATASAAWRGARRSWHGHPKYRSRSEPAS